MAEKMLIYFAQLTHTKNNANQNRAFPLAAGIVSEYLLSKYRPFIEIKLFKTPTKLNTALLNKIPDVLMLSNYLWNENLSCAFANITKQLYPNTLVIMGGPNLNTSKERNIQFLKDNSSIDKLVFHEGEIPVSIIIENYLSHRDINKIKLLDVPNTLGIFENTVIYHDSFVNETNKIGKDTKCLDEIPSPYLSGMFDEFFINGDAPLIETNRGCPFTCAFCQQGNETYKKIRNYSVSRVNEELEYIASKIYKNSLKMDTLYVADSNFAMFNRDGEILEKIKEMQDKYNYPKDVVCSTGKNNAELIIKNTSILRRGSILLRNAVQSLNKDTLDAINRSNIKMESYKQIQDHIVSIGMESSADIMLALPKETKKSHFDGIFELIDTGTKEITCLQTIALKGTKFDEVDYVKTYGIKTKKRVIPACFDTYSILNNNVEIAELDHVIIENNTMSFDDYLECRKLHLIVMMFHNTRLLDPIYEVFRHKNIPKSLLCKRLYTMDNPNLNSIIDLFLKETKEELFDDFNEFKKQNKNLDSVTSNKIFRHLSISFYQRKPVILAVIRDALNDILDNDQILIDDLINILDISIISPFEELNSHMYNVKSVILKQVMSENINIQISERQVSMIKMLDKLFTDPNDKINIMAYHLKPSNMTRQLQYTKDSNV